MTRQRLRSLALQDEGIRHPFRQSLPIGIGKIASSPKANKAEQAANEKWLSDDASLFLLSFLAFFTAFYLFIF